MIILVLVIGMLLTFAGGYQLCEKKMLAPKRKEEAKRVHSLVIDAIGPKTAHYNCEVSTERIFEERLVEAGIMNVIDMTACEAECPNCKPTRDAIHFVEREKRRAERIKMAEEKAVLEMNRGTTTMQFGIDCYVCGKTFWLARHMDKFLCSVCKHKRQAPPIGTSRKGFAGTYPEQKYMEELKMELIRNQDRISEMEIALEKLRVQSNYKGVKARDYKPGETKELDYYEVEVDQLLDSPKRYTLGRGIPDDGYTYS